MKGPITYNLSHFPSLPNDIQTHSLTVFIKTETFSQESTLSALLVRVVGGGGVWLFFFFFCQRRDKERAGGPWHKAFEGRWLQECAFYHQKLCVGMLSLRSAQESSLFFPLIILYCQLRLVLAAYSLLIVNSVDPHWKLQYTTRATAMAGVLVLCNQNWCQYAKET